MMDSIKNFFFFFKFFSLTHFRCVAIYFYEMDSITNLWNSFLFIYIRFSFSSTQSLCCCYPDFSPFFPSLTFPFLYFSTCLSNFPYLVPLHFYHFFALPFWSFFLYCQMIQCQDHVAYRCYSFKILQVIK